MLIQNLKYSNQPGIQSISKALIDLYNKKSTEMSRKPSDLQANQQTIFDGVANFITQDKDQYADWIPGGGIGTMSRGAVNMLAGQMQSGKGFGQIILGTSQVMSNPVGLLLFAGLGLGAVYVSGPFLAFIGPIIYKISSFFGGLWIKAGKTVIKSTVASAYDSQREQLRRLFGDQDLALIQRLASKSGQQAVDQAVKLIKPHTQDILQSFQKAGTQRISVGQLLEKYEIRDKLTKLAQKIQPGPAGKSIVQQNLRLDTGNMVTSLLKKQQQLQESIEQLKEKQLFAQKPVYKQLVRQQPVVIQDSVRGRKFNRIKRNRPQMQLQLQDVDLYSELPTTAKQTSRYMFFPVESSDRKQRIQLDQLRKTYPGKWIRRLRDSIKGDAWIIPR